MIQTTTNFLSYEDLKKYPCIFAERPAEKMTNKYSFIPTIKVIDYFEKLNWLPVSVQTTGKSESAKHLIKFENSNYPEVNGNKFQLFHLNSHNGTSIDEIGIGIFRQICGNGLIAAIESHSIIRQKHIFTTFQEFKKRLENNIFKFNHFIDKIEQYKTIELDEIEKNFFALSAHKTRYQENNPIKPSQLLSVNRPEDNKNDLWTIFNRIQENILKGGLKYSIINKDGKVENHTSRPINNIYLNKKINQFLWAFMAKMATNKTGIM